jgi:hypothetical protein
MKRILAAIIVVSPLSSVLPPAPPKAPTLLAPKIVSPTEIRWQFRNNDSDAVAFELWDVLSRRVISRADDPKASYIAETNVIPADPDMACGRYVVAVGKNGLRSYGQKLTYPCVRTPPVPPSAPRIDIIDKNIIKVTASSGPNDPATAIGIADAKRGNWVSPQNMFVAFPEMLTPGEWGSDLGTTIIGLRPNSSYDFYAVARSVTGEVSAKSSVVSFRMPAEKGDAFAPSLARIGETGDLLGRSLMETFVTKGGRPVIAGIVNGEGVTVTLDDRPFQATVTGTGTVKSFAWTPPSDIGSGYHYLRLGAIRNGSVAWTPTIEFLVKK